MLRLSNIVAAVTVLAIVVAVVVVVAIVTTVFVSVLVVSFVFVVVGVGYIRFDIILVLSWCHLLSLGVFWRPWASQGIPTGAESEK